MGSGDLILLKCHSPQIDLDINVVTIKCLGGYFCGNWQANSKIHMKIQRIDQYNI